MPLQQIVPRNPAGRVAMLAVPNKGVPANRPVVFLPAVTLPRFSIFDHGVSRIDRSGRVHDARLWAALGWQPGRELHLALGRTRLRVTAVPGDEVTATTTLDSRGRLRVPLALRAALGIDPGDLVMLSADTGRDLLVLTSCRVLDQLVDCDG